MVINLKLQCGYHWSTITQLQGKTEFFSFHYLSALKLLEYLLDTYYISGKKNIGAGTKTILSILFWVTCKVMNTRVMNPHSELYINLIPVWGVVPVIGLSLLP